MRKALFLPIAFLLSAPVWADTTADYHAAGGRFEMHVEVASNGDVRGEVKGQNAYFLTIGGAGYLVLTTPQGPVVDRLADVGTILAETLDATLAQQPDLKNAMEKQQPAIEIKERGIATIGGRTGRAFFFARPDGSLSTQPVAVISDDPGLAELGKAMAHQFEISTKMNPMAAMGGFSTRMLTILQSGTALTFGGGELGAVKSGAIDPARFALPGTSESLDQVRVRFKANGGHLP